MAPRASAPSGDQEDTKRVYDAFVSYSRIDKAFAAALTRTLESYKAPKDLALPQRNLKIFRDEAAAREDPYSAPTEK